MVPPSPPPPPPKKSWVETEQKKSKMKNCDLLLSSFCSAWSSSTSSHFTLSELESLSLTLFFSDAESALGHGNLSVTVRPGVVSLRFCCLSVSF